MKFLKIIIQGEAPSQGSMKAFPFKKKNGGLGVNQIHQDNKGIKKFRESVKKELEDKYKEFYTDNPDQAFSIDVIFYLDRPKTVKRTFPTRRTDKDLDKRIRALLDALTRNEVYNPYGVFDDDSQVVKITAVKKYIETCKQHEHYNSGCTQCNESGPRTIVKISKVYLTKDNEIEIEQY